MVSARVSDAISSGFCDHPLLRRDDQFAPTDLSTRWLHESMVSTTRQEPYVRPGQPHVPC